MKKGLRVRIGFVWLRIKTTFRALLNIIMIYVGFEVFTAVTVGCGAVWVYYKPTFRRKASPPSSE
jgi:hypothetical protein